MENEWYKASEKDRSVIPAPEEVSAGTRAKKCRGWLPWATAAVCVLLLIAGSSLLFGGGDSGEVIPASIAPHDGFQEPEETPDREDLLPEFGGSFRDFFEKYYTPYESHEDCNIRRVDPLPGGSLTLRPQSNAEMALPELYEKCAPSVVAVMAYLSETNDNLYYFGSGVILSADGLIATNAHVLEGTVRAKVLLADNTEHEALLVGSDARSDIAVLKIDASGLPAAEFCDGDALRVGDAVIAIGNPLGLEFRSSMTEGIISGIDRDISHDGVSMSLLQNTAPVNEGNSGGPLFNRFGQVVGITNMKMSANYIGSVTIEGVSLAIPSRTVKNSVDSLLLHGKVLGRPALGITVGAIPEEAMEEYKLPAGLYISAVSKGSDCEAKGVKSGDILLKVDGDPVTKTEDVMEHIKPLQVGDSLTLTLWREEKKGAGRTFEVTVKLMEVIDVY